jgi:hypothetical protein
VVVGKHVGEKSAKPVPGKKDVVKPKPTAKDGNKDATKSKPHEPDPRSGRLRRGTSKTRD